MEEGVVGVFGWLKAKEGYLTHLYYIHLVFMKSVADASVVCWSHDFQGNRYLLEGGIF